MLVCEIIFQSINAHIHKQKYVHGKKFGTDAAPSGRAVAFTGGELCDYTFEYAAFPQSVINCPFFGEQLTYVEGT